MQYALSARPIALAEARRERIEVLEDRQLGRTERSKKLKDIEARIDDLENPLKPFYAPPDFHLHQAKLGNIGWYDDQSISVAQVVDDSNTLLHISFSVGESEIGSKRLWLSGVSTAGVTDYNDITLDGVFAITGTKSYETLNGSSTVFIMEQIDTKQFEDKFTRRSDLRTWQSKDEKHTTEAIIVRAVRGSVTLMSLDGKSKTVELSEPSDDDRKYVRDELRHDAELQKQIPLKQRYRATKTRDGRIVLEAE
jgi:hypothetical protein